MNLTYLFITFGLSMALGVTASGHSDTETIEKPTITKKNAITTDTIGDKYYWSKGGDGNFYNGTITEANSYQCSESEGAVLYADFYLTKYNATYVYKKLYFEVRETPAPHYITDCYLATDNNGSTGAFTLVIYDLFGTSAGVYSENKANFLVKNVRGYEGNISYFLETFFYYENMSPATYSINKNFNYNAPYGYIGGSSFITDNTLTNNNLLVSKTYDYPYFISNGQVFNRIVIDYMSAYGSRYIDANGEAQICETEGFGYYSHMRYVNTYSNLDKIVNQRNFSTFTDSGGNIQYAINNGSAWVNSAYQEVTPYQKLTPEQKNTIETLNTNLGAGYITPYSELSNNIGLSNVFALIGSAFMAVGGFLAIQVMPGLTLGILLFAPLIVSIIIAVIWIVKR